MNLFYLVSHLNVPYLTTLILESSSRKGITAVTLMLVFDSSISSEQKPDFESQLCHLVSMELICASVSMSVKWE